MEEEFEWNILVVSDCVTPTSQNWNATCTREEMGIAHGMVMVNCDQAEPYIAQFNDIYASQFAPGNEEHRVKTFNFTFGKWVYILTLLFTFSLCFSIHAYNLLCRWSWRDQEKEN